MGPFLILALAAVWHCAVVRGLQGSGSHANTSPQGHVGIARYIRPLLLGALGSPCCGSTAWGGHARASVGCLGLLTALTGMIQVGGSGNPILRTTSLGWGERLNACWEV